MNRNYIYLNIFALWKRYFEKLLLFFYFYKTKILLLLLYKIYLFQTKINHCFILKTQQRLRLVISIYFITLEKWDFVFLFFSQKRYRFPIAKTYHSTFKKVRIIIKRIKYIVEKNSRYSNYFPHFRSWVMICIHTSEFFKHLLKLLIQKYFFQTFHNFNFNLIHLF